MAFLLLLLWCPSQRVNLTRASKRIECTPIHRSLYIEYNQNNTGFNVWAAGLLISTYDSKLCDCTINAIKTKKEKTKPKRFKPKHSIWLKLLNVYTLWLWNLIFQPNTQIYYINNNHRMNDLDKCIYTSTQKCVYSIWIDKKVLRLWTQSFHIGLNWKNTLLYIHFGSISFSFSLTFCSDLNWKHLFEIFTFGKPCVRGRMVKR